MSYVDTKQVRSTEVNALRRELSFLTGLLEKHNENKSFQTARSQRSVNKHKTNAVQNGEAENPLSVINLHKVNSRSVIRNTYIKSKNVTSGVISSGAMQLISEKNKTSKYSLRNAVPAKNMKLHNTFSPCKVNGHNRIITANPLHSQKMYARQNLVFKKNVPTTETCIVNNYKYIPKSDILNAANKSLYCVSKPQSYKYVKSGSVLCKNNALSQNSENSVSKPFSESVEKHHLPHKYDKVNKIAGVIMKDSNKTYFKKTENVKSASPKEIGSDNTVNANKIGNDKSSAQCNKLTSMNASRLNSIAETDFKQSKSLKIEMCDKKIMAVQNKSILNTKTLCKTLKIQNKTSTPRTLLKDKIYKKSANKIKQYVESPKSKIARNKLCFIKSPLSSSRQNFKYSNIKANEADENKPSPCIQKLKIISTQYKVVNKNSRIKKSVKSPSHKKYSNNQKTLTLNKTCNKSVQRIKSPKNICRLPGKKVTSLTHRNSPLNSRYKIVNKKAADTQSVSSNILTTSACKINNRQLYFQETPISKRNVCDSSLSSILPKEKMSKLTFIKSSEYEGYDLTDISPTQLVSLEPDMLLKLSKLYKTPSKKSGPKLNKKRMSPAYQAARMLKTKYKIVNKRNSQRLLNKSFVISQKQRTKSPKVGFYPNSVSWKSYNKKSLNIYKSHAAARAWNIKNKASTRKLYENGKYKKRNFVKIGDISYRVTNVKLTRTYKKSPKQFKKDSSKKKKPTVLIIRGIKFEMDSSGKSLKKLQSENDHAEKQAVLKRIDIGGKTYMRTAQGLFVQSSSPQIRSLASRVLNRSIQTVWAATTKKSVHKNNVYCMFYNRFGRCNHGEKCSYIHDPSKVAVCTRFLRGTCKTDDCPFSHEVSLNKMAVCSYYLQGTCTNLNCPYRHDKVEPNAKLCKAFVRGYCSNGSQCKKAHVLVCPQFIQGCCEKGADCAYPHPPRKKQKISQEDSKIQKNEDITTETTENEDYRYFEKISELYKEKNEFNEDKCNKRMCLMKNSLSAQPDFLSLSVTMDSP